MAKDKGPWQDGRRAWERLNGWHQDSPSASPGHPNDGSAAVEALADIGLVRHLLDQAELIAVRTARAHGKSWAEIATKLGITRQSAWERWRELDDAPASMDPASMDPASMNPAPADRPSVKPEVVGLRARDQRRRSTVTVPNVVGSVWSEALQDLAQVGLIGIGSDLFGEIPTAETWPGAVVLDQSPESGAWVESGSAVTLWRRPGDGSAGVREPRRPGPAPRSARARRTEPSDEAVG